MNRLTTCMTIILLFVVSTVCDAQYTLIDLGTLGGSQSIAYGINNSCQVVGNSDLGNGFSHAFRTAANQPINPATDDLHTMNSPDSVAYDINESGQVCGDAFFSFGQGGLHVFRTAANEPIFPSDDLVTQNTPQHHGAAMNNSGQVVGWSEMNGAWHAFRTVANQPINPATDDLTPSGGIFTEALDINDIGQVVINANSLAYRTAANAPLNSDTDCLGTLGGQYSSAYGINNLGEVVGSASILNGESHAFRTAANQPINSGTDDLGTLGGNRSAALDINNTGIVVGWSYSSGSTNEHAFVYYGDGPMQDLNQLIVPGSGWVLQRANAINDLGQIVGYGTIGGNTRAFLLTPIPEPATFALLGIGVVSLFVYGWRRWQREK